MGSSLCKRFSLLGIAYPIVGKYFQVQEVHLGMKHIKDLSCEKGLYYGLFMYFVKFWTFIQFLLNFGQKPSFCICNEKEL